jgi:hypothetical protein
MPYQVFAQDVTIASGSSTSDPIPITGLMLVAVSVPSSITGNRLAIQVRLTPSGTFQTVRDKSGPVYSTIAGSCFLVFDLNATQLLAHFDAIRLLTTDSNNAAVNQTSNVTVRVFLSPI